ncbi:MAG: hypothetical protein IPM51_05370 [Sphingobacteriaceae bacterium]|nr:hypothetical protein [Sphingobacteriaceae bacterium]
MKKLLFTAVVALISVSCAKDRNCTCTTTSTIPGSTPTTLTWTFVEVTKGQAKVNCASKVTSVTNGTTTVTYTDDCKLD